MVKIGSIGSQMPQIVMGCFRKDFWWLSEEHVVSKCLYDFTSFQNNKIVNTMCII